MSGCLCRCTGTDFGLFCRDVTGALAITASILMSLLSPINVTYKNKVTGKKKLLNKPNKHMKKIMSAKFKEKMLHLSYIILRIQRTKSELQIREGTDDNSKISFLFLNGNICCDPSLEPSQRDSSNNGSQNMFLWRNIANYP